MGACYSIKDSNPKDRILGYTLVSGPSTEFSRNLRLVTTTNTYYAVTEGEAGTEGEDYGYCAPNNDVSSLLDESDFETLYQVKYPSEYFDLWLQGHNACNTDGCDECTLWPENQQPLCYLLNDSGKDKFCSSVDAQINPIYYLTFGGNVSYQTLLMFYPMILLLFICIFVNLLCFRPLILGETGNKFRSVERKVEVFDDDDDENDDEENDDV